MTTVSKFPSDKDAKDSNEQQEQPTGPFTSNWDIFRDRTTCHGLKSVEFKRGNTWLANVKR